MHILKKDSDLSFEIVPRRQLSQGYNYKIVLKNEYTTLEEEIDTLVERLPNENYLLTLQDIPVFEINQKFSFELIELETEQIVMIGQLMFIDTNEPIQDYTKGSNIKYY